MARAAGLFQLALFATFLVGTGGATGAKAADALAQMPAPPIREFDLATIERLGQAMFEQDRQAAAATDALFARKSDLNLDGVKGWIVTPSLNGAIVRFATVQDGQPRPAFDVAVPRSGPATANVSHDRNFTPQEEAQFAARTLAIQNIEQPCSKQYNTVVLREPGAENWLVWTLAATTERDVIVVGGHFRFTISPDGQRVIAKDRLSRSCIAIPRQPQDSSGKAVGAFVTHIVSASPVEAHVFLSLMHQVPLYVGVADNKVWVADRGRLTQVR